MFFATNPLAYAAAALMILLLLGLAERQLGAAHGRVLFAGQFAAVTLFLLMTQLARYAGDGWLGLMVDARLIGPYAAVLAVVAGVQRTAADPVAAAAAHGRAVGVAAARAVRGACGDGSRACRGAGRPGGRMVDPGRHGHPAPAPLHRPRNPQPPRPHRGDLRRRTHPDGRGPDPHRSAGLLRDVVLNPLPTLSQLEQNCGRHRRRDLP